MADILPINFPVPSETAVASYPYLDITEGTGTVLYYGASQRAAATSYLLHATAFYSQDTYQTVYSGGGSASGSEEYNFNLAPFNTPKIAEGNGFINMTVEGQKNSSNGYIEISVRIIKYDGSSETALCSAVTQTVTIPGSTTTSKTVLIPFTLTKTNFKIGDNLRLELIITWSVAAGSFQGITFGIDPADRHAFTTADNTSSVLSLYIPYRLNT